MKQATGNGSCENLHGKSREFTLGELIFWQVFDIWNHCVIVHVYYKYDDVDAFGKSEFSRPKHFRQDAGSNSKYIYHDNQHSGVAETFDYNRYSSVTKWYSYSSEGKFPKEWFS